MTPSALLVSGISFASLHHAHAGPPAERRFYGIAAANFVHPCHRDRLTTAGHRRSYPPTNASGHKSVLDFVFVSGDAAGWTYESSILQEQGDFPDDAVKSDHRPIDAVFTFDPHSPSARVPAEAAASEGAEHDSAALLQRIEKLEKELEELRGLLEHSNDDQ